MNDYINNRPEEEEKDELQYFCKFTFGQFFTLLILEVVTLGFVFYLGAKYGNDYIKIAKEEQPIEVVSAGRQLPAGLPVQQPIDAQSQSNLQDPSLQTLAREALAGKTDDEIKQKVQEILNREKVPAVTESQPSAQQQLTPSQQQALEEARAALNAGNSPQPVQQNPAENNQAAQQVAPVEMNKADKTDDSGVIRMKSPSNAQFSVQVGSYPKMDEANGKMESWRNKGYPAFIMIADIPDRGRWYRVRIGGFGSKEEAQNYLEKLKTKEGDIEAIVVLNEQ